MNEQGNTAAIVFVDTAKSDPTPVPLVDDLADVLARMVWGWEEIIGADLAQHPDVVRVMARYRSSKMASILIRDEEQGEDASQPEP